MSAGDPGKMSQGIRQRHCVTVITGINSFITVLGLVVTGCGVFVKVGGSLLYTQIDRVLEWLTDGQPIARLDGMDTNTFRDVVVEVLLEISSPLIVIGLYLCVASLFGTFGARAKVSVILVLFTVLVFIGLLIQGFVLLLLFSQRQIIGGVLKPMLMSGLQDNYRGYNETNFVSQAWNVIMVTFKCCGIDDYRDFYDASNWRRRLFQDGWWFYLQTPVACCSMDRKGPDDFACAVNPLDYTSNYKKGCYEAVWDIVYLYKGTVLTVLLVFIVSQIVLFVVCCMLMHDIRKGCDKSEDHDEDAGENGHHDLDERETIENTCIDKNRTNDKLNCEMSGTVGLLNSLPFLNIDGRHDINDMLQQNHLNNKRNSIDLLTQFLTSQGRCNRMSYDFGFQNGRMPAFEFNIPHNRSSFDYGAPSMRLPTGDYGDSRGPIIVQLPRSEPLPNSNIRAITETTEERPAHDTSTNVHMTMQMTDNETAQKKTGLKEVGRCKSESCINSRRNTKLPLKDGLSRTKTLPKIKEEKKETQDK